MKERCLKLSKLLGCLIYMMTSQLWAGMDGVREKIDFNQDWRFERFGTMPGGHQKKEVDGIASSNFDDQSWRKLNLPHDWAIEGPFDINLPGGTGKLPWKGIGWYRKTISIPVSDRDKNIFLDIDGAMANSEIFINGRKVGGRPYGYISFRTNLTDYIKYGEKNVLAIRLNTEKWGSRWYPGAGIYRNTWLVKTSKVHVSHGGVHIQTPMMDSEKGIVDLGVSLTNSSPVPIRAKVRSSIYEYGTQAVLGVLAASSDEAWLDVDPGMQGATSLSATVKHPKLWDTVNPNRYLARTEVWMGDKLVDRIDQPFGFRTLKFTPRDGFYLNGRRVEIKGVCMHHDLGPLGGAFNWRAAERQIEIMKEMGVNAIRTSHNQPAPEIMELCDRMGILLQVETFDCWRKGKTKDDYGDLFDEWHERDLVSIIKLCRNHPSVFMWCLGNEVGEQDTTEGIEIVRRLREITRQYDKTRPVTVGVSKVKPGFNGFQHEVDVFGYNYRLMAYEPWYKDENNKNIPMHGSETSSCISSRGEYFFPVPKDLKSMQSAGVPKAVTSKWAPNRNGTKYGTGENLQITSYDIAATFWACTPDYQFMMLDMYPATLGEFVWTGFDYLGEPTPYNNDKTNVLNEPDPKKRAELLKFYGSMDNFTTRSSFFGIVDLCGFKKDRFYSYQSRWKPELPMAHIFPHWNWPDRVGKVTPVHVYTSGDEAELFLNGKSLGRKKKNPFEYRLMWSDVVYAPGTIKVIAYKNGEVWAEDVVNTTGKAAKVVMEADRNVIHSDGYDLSFVTVSITDKKGELIPRADDLIQFSIEGPGEIVAVGNGNANSHEPFQADFRKAYNGLCLVVIKAKASQRGHIKLFASAKSLTSSPLTLEVK